MAELDAPEFTITCDLRWSDFDRLGHLNQAIYHVLLEQVRTAWLLRVQEKLGRTEAFVLAHVDLDHRREVDTSHRRAVAMARLLRVGTSSITVAQQLRFENGTVAATGQSVMVGWDPVSRGKRAFADDEREAFLLA